jgi:hypothetical protein
VGQFVYAGHGQQSFKKIKEARVKKSFNRKSLLLPLLLLATGSAWAGWEEVATTDKATIYVDRATIRKDGNLRKMGLLQDLKKRTEVGALSRRIRSEYDCKGERRRILALSTHAESMAGGNTIKSFGEDPEGWEAVPPGTITEELLKIACAQ